MMGQILRGLSRLVVATALTAVFANPAQAGTIDITLFELLISDDGAVLEIDDNPGATYLSWTGGGGGGPVLAEVDFNTSLGTFAIRYDDGVGFAPMLSGNILGFTRSIDVPGPGGTWTADLSATASPLFGLGPYRLMMSSFDFNSATGLGTGIADVVPEPTTWVFVALGIGMIIAATTLQKAAS